MTTAETWAKRVAAWRGSGKSAREFSQGQGYTAGGLRYWASELKRRAEGARRAAVVATVKPVDIAATAVAASSEQASPPKPASARVRRKAIRIARVIRTKVPAAPAAWATAQGTIVFDYGGTRVAVGTDFDRATLRALLDELGKLCSEGRS